MSTQKFQEKSTDYEKMFIDRLTKVTNRSNNQTKFLLDLLDGNFLKLIELEEKIKNNNTIIPGNKQEVDNILSMDYGEYWWKINFFADSTLTKNRRS